MIVETPDGTHYTAPIVRVQPNGWVHLQASTQDPIRVQTPGGVYKRLIDVGNMFLPPQRIIWVRG